MTVKLVYMHFLLKVVVYGAYFKNPTGAILAPLGIFIDVMSHAHVFTYL